MSFFDKHRDLRERRRKNETAGYTAFAPAALAGQRVVQRAPLLPQHIANLLRSGKSYGVRGSWVRPAARGVPYLEGRSFVPDRLVPLPRSPRLTGARAALFLRSPATRAMFAVAARAFGPVVAASMIYDLALVSARIMAQGGVKQPNWLEFAPRIGRVSHVWDGVTNGQLWGTVPRWAQTPGLPASQSFIDQVRNGATASLAQLMPVSYTPHATGNYVRLGYSVNITNPGMRVRYGVEVAPGLAPAFDIPAGVPQVAPVRPMVRPLVPAPGRWLLDPAVPGETLTAEVEALPSLPYGRPVRTPPARSGHTFSPPPAGTKERKLNIRNLGTLSKVLRGFEALTEAIDWTNVLYEALPKHRKVQMYKLFGRQPRPHEKAALVFIMIREVDAEKAIIGLVDQELEDRFFAAMGKAAKGIYRHTGQLTGADRFASSMMKFEGKYLEGQSPYKAAKNELTSWVEGGHDPVAPMRGQE